jgi:hypothetical protein
VIDLVDVENNRLVWRAIATATLQGTPKKNVPLVREVIRKMFVDFPPER